MGNMLKLILLSAAVLLFCTVPVRAQEASGTENTVEDVSDTKETEEGTTETAAEAEEEDVSADTGDAEKTEEEKPAEKPDVNELLFKYARKLLASGKFDEAEEICDLLLKEDPDSKALLAFKGTILNARRELNTLKKYVNSDKNLNDVIASAVTPEQPEDVDRPVSKPVIELVSGMNRDQRAAVKKKLNQRISLNVLDASLSYVLNLLFRGTGINIIADQSVLADKQLTIQVEDIPLEGVLNYISRLEGITYSISHETVWITSSDKPMLETRIIRLKSGLTDVLEQLDPLENMTSSAAGIAGGGTGAPSAANSDMEKLLARIADIIEWPQGSNWVLDKKTNTLFVRSTSDAIDKFEKVVDAVDYAPLQVLIEAKFVEISDGDLNDVGIEWQIAQDARIRGIGPDAVDLNTGSGTNFTFNSRTGGKVDFASSTRGMDLFLTGVLSGPQFDAVLHAINTKDSSHTLSSPTLLTINNFLGTIKVTTDLVYIEGYTVDRSTIQSSSLTAGQSNGFTNGDDDGDGLRNEDPVDGVDNDGDGSFDEDDVFGYTNGNTTGSEPVILPEIVTDFEGVVLKVLPSIGLDGKIITMSLQPEVKEKVGEEKFNLVIPDYEGTAEVVRPIMNRRTFITKLSIADGSTVVLGGLKREREIKSVSRVPVLGNIPILGRLFSRTYTERLTSNLLIFVTAHILEPSGSRYKPAEKPEKIILYQTPDGKRVTSDELKEILRKGKKRK